MPQAISIRVRLTLWYGTALAVILVTFAVVLYAEMARGLKDQVDRSLEEAATVAIRSLESSRLGPFLQFEDLSA
jgi:two-component system OmpR family sensor kinase